MTSYFGLLGGVILTYPCERSIRLREWSGFLVCLLSKSIHNGNSNLCQIFIFESKNIHSGLKRVGRIFTEYLNIGSK